MNFINTLICILQFISYTMHAAVCSEYLEVYTLSALLSPDFQPAVNNGFAYYEFLNLSICSPIGTMRVLVKTHMTSYWSMYELHD